MSAIKVLVQAEPIKTDQFDEFLSGDDFETGAIASFKGLCRDEGGRLNALELEHYPGMAEAALQNIAQQAAARWPLARLVAIHRYGVINPGEVIVYVAATSRHRDAAFDGARFIMDFLKTDAPFWKKEHPKDGGESAWVSATDKDDAARQRWRVKP